MYDLPDWTEDVIENVAGGATEVNLRTLESFRILYALNVPYQE